MKRVVVAERVQRVVWGKKGQTIHALVFYLVKARLKHTDYFRLGTRRERGNG